MERGYLLLRCPLFRTRLFPPFAGSLIPSIVPLAFAEPLRRIVLCAALIVPALTGCEKSPAPNATERAELTGMRGVALEPPMAKPSFVLTRADGSPFDFQNETAGKVALLFFGYTHCPDVCPLHMANIAAVLKPMSFEQRDRVKVIFITNDPARDTPARLAEWLGAFDPSFIALTGDLEEINRIAFSLRFPPGIKQPMGDGKDTTRYLVGHASQVLAFSRDGLARYAYPFGTRQEDWANDLPKLLGEDDAPASAAQAAKALQPADQLKGTLVVSRPAVAAPPTLTEASMYFTVVNATSTTDTLLSISTDISASAEIHQQMEMSGSTMMHALTTLPIAPLGPTALTPGNLHVMLLTLSRKVVPGDTVRARLNFSNAGIVELRVPVVAYADLERTLGGAPTGNPPFKKPN